MPDKSVSAKAGKPIPRCKAMLLCERAIREAGTNQHSLIGIIRKIVVPQFPALSQPMVAYLQLAEGIGEYAISMEVRDLTTGQSLARGHGATIAFQDRLAVLEILMPLPPLPLHHAGSFELVAFAQGQEIDRQKFTVSCAMPGGTG